MNPLVLGCLETFWYGQVVGLYLTKTLILAQQDFSAHTHPCPWGWNIF